jgi:hypothetical protein
MAFHTLTSPRNRIVLLGASNLTLSLRLVIHLMQQRFGGPGEILATIGHGRAYGVASQMMGRGLPGIAACGLWRQLDSMEPCPTYAVLTDVGNDILYGAMPEQILHAVEWCIEQLQKHSAQIVVTNLPMASIERLSERRYLFFRNIFYPFCRLPRNETVSRAQAVYSGLMDMAARCGFKLYEQEPGWFGLDGIHVNYWKRRAYYQHILEQFPLSAAEQAGVENKEQLLLTWQQRPQFAHKTVMARAMYCRQPSGRLPDGSVVFKY